MNWSFLTLPGLIAVPAVWSQYLGAAYPAFRKLCLQQDNWYVESYPCPRECGCWHQVILHPDRTAPTGANARCQCAQLGIRPVSDCPNFALTLTEINPLKLNQPKLAREICRALSLNSRLVELAPDNTIQIGSWSADAVPVALTFQNDYVDLENVVAQLGMRLQRPFILLAPTTELVTAECNELLAHAKSALFGLDSIVTLTDQGTLTPMKSPGELFIQFNPQSRDPVPEDTARQLFALAKTLDAQNIGHKAPPSAVLHLFCAENHEPPQIAHELHCSRALVYARLDLLRQKLGRDPSELLISSHAAASAYAPSSSGRNLAPRASNSCFTAAEMHPVLTSGSRLPSLRQDRMSASKTSNTT
jgi:hypothetical protein